MASEPREMRPVEDCILPVADGLEEIVKRWNVVGAEPPTANRIEQLYTDHEVKSLIVWLEMKPSVDFAFVKDFEAHLYGPLQQFQKLEFRALQILAGDIEGTTTEAPCRPNPITTVINREYDTLRMLPDDRRDQGREENPILQELENPYCGIRNEFRETMAYLRRVAKSGRLGGTPKPAETDPPVDGSRCSRANTKQLFPKGIPSDTNTFDVAVRLREERAKPEGERRTDIDIAREYTRETAGSDSKAKKILANIRTRKNRGQVNL